jgi:type II secretory pathway pseudopilin PulG
MKLNFNRGFTLIELIGILASVVLASLSTARTKAASAAYQTEVQQMVAAALLTCDAGAGPHVTAVGSQTPATTIPCPAFLAGTVLQVTPTDITLAQCGSVSINGAVFSGAVCP